MSGHQTASPTTLPPLDEDADPAWAGLADLLVTLQNQFTFVAYIQRVMKLRHSHESALD